MVPTCNLSTQEVKAGGAETEAILAYLMSLG